MAVNARLWSLPLRRSHPFRKGACSSIRPNPCLSRLSLDPASKCHLPWACFSHSLALPATLLRPPAP